MLIKCTCNNCTAHLEFESQNAGTVIACPKCGMDTKLYTPPAPAASRTQNQTDSRTPPAYSPELTTAAMLREVRSATCYRTLRSLIDVGQFLLCLIAGISLFGAVLAFQDSASRSGFSTAIGLALGSVIFSILCAILALAGKQAAVVLIDIADCQIRAATKSS